VLDILPVEAGAFYVMDRGYVDFARLYAMHQAGAFFVTRAKRGMDARRVYSSPTQRDTGVICDQRVMLNGHYSAKAYPEHLRRVRFKDPESGKTLIFLTNNTTLPALTIAALYKSRVGHIRQAAIGDALVPYTERVDRALSHLLADPASGKPWSTPQRDWLKKIAAQTKANTLVDRDALDDPDLLFKTQGGGFQRLDKMFGGQLTQTLDAFNDSIWARPAA
jgi:hypothetical protein